MTSHRMDDFATSASFRVVLCSTLIAASALMITQLNVGPVNADTRDGGRYTMKEIDGGFIRLDTQTGTMSTCTKDNGKWNCDALPDSQKALRDEVEKLRSENTSLKNELRQMEEVFGLRDAPADGTKPKGHAQGKPQLNLPSEEQVDQAVDYLERMIRKFRKRFENFGDKTNPRRLDPKDRDSRPL